jgi:type I restriction enzyme M protein
VSDDSGDFLLDKHNHWIVDHDLFNHDGLTEDGIAEAFIEFAKKENLSFFEIPPANATSLIKGDRGGAFDAVKYQQLMDRLEAAEVRFSEIDLGDRFDAEYFWKENLIIQAILKKKNTIAFYKLGHFVASAFYPAATQYYEIGDTPFIRCVDCIKYPLITNDQDDIFEKLPYSFVKESKGINLLSQRDMVITKVGTPCYASLLEEHKLVALSRTVLGVQKIKDVDPYYLLIFLRCKYGFNQLYRARELTIQYQLTLARVKNVRVYQANQDFQKLIRTIVYKYLKLIQVSKKLYQQAEDLLLTELSLKDWQPTEESIAVKSFSESFLSSGRLDAEYYQPKYDQLYQSLKTATLRNGWQLKKLSELSSLFKYGVSDSLEYIEEGVPFLRIADLNKHRFSQENLKFISNESAKKYKETVRQGDVIISRSGTLGIAVVIPEFLTNAVYGSYFILTRPKKELVLPTYLALYLNSLAGKMQTEQSNTGGIQTNLTIPVLESLVIACPSLESQQKFVNKVHDSYNAEEKSKQLLEVAKIGVEKAIETDEETATAWINQQLESLGVKLI